MTWQDSYGSDPSEELGRLLDLHRKEQKAEAALRVAMNTPPIRKARKRLRRVRAAINAMLEAHIREHGPLDPAAPGPPTEL
jgi:hypothetical protein